MEDFKVILYILAAIAFFLFNAWRKAFKGEDENLPSGDPPVRRPASQPQPSKPQSQRQQPPQRQPQYPQGPVVPPTSFEDILRELQPKAERAKEQARPTVETVRETVMTETKARPVVNYEKPAEVPLSLENREEAIEAIRRAQRRKIVTEMPLEAYRAASGKKASKYGEMLRNPQTVRDAIILSEILQRKYN